MVSRDASCSPTPMEESRERRVQWTYSHAGAAEHVSEALEGSRCAFCNMECRSFRVKYERSQMTR